MEIPIFTYEKPHMARLPEEAADDAAAATDFAVDSIRKDDGASTILIVAVGATDDQMQLCYRLRWARAGREEGLAVCLGAVPGIASLYPLRARLCLAWAIIFKRRPGNWDGRVFRSAQVGK